MSSAAEASEPTMYRMPTVFGPSFGPRQRGTETPWPSGESGASEQRVVRTTLRTDAAALTKLLPRHYSLRGEPRFIITATYLQNVRWLAGRGYNIVSIEVPVSVEVADRRIDGTFTPVLWESSPEAVMTGREELGMSKLYADIPDPTEGPDSIRCVARWDGFEFIALTITNLAPAGFEPTMSGLAGFSYKYVPKSCDWGAADASYTTMVPPQTIETLGLLKGQASVHFGRPQWEDMPTMHTIVDQLADLPILAVSGGSVLRVRPHFDGRDLVAIPEQG